MKLLASFTALGLVLAASGPAFAQQAADPETAQFMCDLTGDCATSTAEPAADAAATPSASPQRRVSDKTRGFSFRRANQGGTATTTPTVVASNTVTSATVAPRIAVNRPAQIGQTNMGLTFVPGSATLTETARARLARYAVALQNPRLVSRRLRIEGHTDATGSAQANEVLSRQRAQAAADFLEAAGVDASRLEVVGFGSRRPLTGTAPNAAANRRVMAVLL